MYNTIPYNEKTKNALEKKKKALSSVFPRKKQPFSPVTITYLDLISTGEYITNDLVSKLAPESAHDLQKRVYAMKNSGYLNKTGKGEVLTVNYDVVKKVDGEWGKVEVKDGRK